MKNVFKLKSVIIIISVCFVFSAILAVIILSLCSPEEQGGVNSEYYPANYEEDIFLNKAYMEFQHDMLYSIGGVEQLFSYEKDYDSSEPECQFFLKYFHTVIHGDYETYKTFFVDGYFEEDPKFTMQMIYDPYVMYHSTSTDEFNGEEISLLNFQVRYRIFKNNKTYRSDIDSNVAVPQIYQLIKEENGSYRIFRILNIEVEDAD